MKKLVLLLSIISLQSYASILYKIDYGINLYNQNNYRSAAIYFQNYISSNPNDEDGYFWLGKTFSAQNLEYKATLAFKQAYAIAVNNKNIDKIEFENNEFDNLEDYIDIAISYYEQKNYQEAQNYADMMLKIDPDCAGAYFIKSKITYINGDKTKSGEYFKQAVLLNNSFLKTKLAKKLGIEKIPELTKEEYAVYAQKNYYKGDINSAIKCLNKYVELDNNNIDIYLSLINCYLKNQNLNLAKSAISDAQKISKNNVSLMLMEAELARLNNEDYSNILLNAKEINPNNKEVLLKLANFYLESKDFINSKKHFETLINIDDSNYEAYFGYIYSLIMLEDTDNITELIRKLSNINKNQAEISYLLSLLCYTKAQYKDSLDYILSSIKIDTNPQYMLQAGKLNYILGNYQASIDFLKNINSMEAIEYLIADYIQSSRWSEAEKLLANFPFDKNRILYKYYLYKISKLNSKKELNFILKQKPTNALDYLDLAKIYYFEGRNEDKERILNIAEKKFEQNKEIKFKIQELKYKNSLSG